MRKLLLCILIALPLTGCETVDENTAIDQPAAPIDQPQYNPDRRSYIPWREDWQYDNNDPRLSSRGQRFRDTGNQDRGERP